MHKYKQAAISIAFLTIIFTSGICAGYIDMQEKRINRKNLTRQEAILETFESNNFQAWKKLMAKEGSICQVIEQEDFSNFVSAREAARSGEYDKAIVMAQNIEMIIKNKMGLNLLA